MPTPVKVPATVTGITSHGDDVYSLQLSPKRQVPDYLPGQFLHLAMDPYDPSSHWPESRVFSIATSPTRAPELRVTFAAKGPFTRRMATSLHEGDTVWLKLPYGEFTLDRNRLGGTVLIAGGTGVTPFVAFLEFLLDRQETINIQLFYGVRKASLLLYQSLIEECAKRLQGFSVEYFVESGDFPAAAGPWHRGRLSVAAILEKVENPLRAAYYLAGPPQMIQAFVADFSARAIKKEQVHVDAWE